MDQNEARAAYMEAMEALKTFEREARAKRKELKEARDLAEYAYRRATSAEARRERAEAICATSCRPVWMVAPADAIHGDLWIVVGISEGKFLLERAIGEARASYSVRNGHALPYSMGTAYGRLNADETMRAWREHCAKLKERSKS